MRRGMMIEEQQRYLAPLEEQLEAMEKAIVTARGLKRANLDSEIKVWLHGDARSM